VDPERFRQSSRMTRREVEIERRTRLLAENFEGYLCAFDRDPAFRKSGQCENHIATIGLRREIGGAVSAAHDAPFLRSLYETLGTWGIGQRGSTLVDFDRFADAIGNCESSLRVLEDIRLEETTPDVERASDMVWELITSLEIVENQAKLVPCTKALHHLLPDLIVPMDRAFTRRFFAWHVPEFQYQQEKVFRHAFRHFVKIARDVRPSQFAGSGWRTSATKILDNALVGFCRVENILVPS